MPTNSEKRETVTDPPQQKQLKRIRRKVGDFMKNTVGDRPYGCLESSALALGLPRRRATEHYEWQLQEPRYGPGSPFSQAYVVAKELRNAGINAAAAFPNPDILGDMLKRPESEGALIINAYDSGAHAVALVKTTKDEILISDIQQRPRVRITKLEEVAHRFSDPTKFGVIIVDKPGVNQSNRNPGKYKFGETLKVWMGEDD